MHGQAPLSVSAIAQTEKPDVYPKVDDEATVILRYPKAQAVLMPSWNWPFSRNDVELYGATGYAATVGADKLRVRYRGEKAETVVRSAARSKSRIEFAGFTWPQSCTAKSNRMGIRRRWRPMLWWCKFWMQRGDLRHPARRSRWKKLPD